MSPFLLAPDRFQNNFGPNSNGEPRCQQEQPLGLSVGQVVRVQREESCTPTGCGESREKQAAAGSSLGAAEH